MKKILALLLLLCVTIILVASAVTVFRPIQAADAGEARPAGAPAIQPQPQPGEGCENAVILYTSYPAKCMTAKGLEVANPFPAQPAPAGSP